MIVSFIFSFLFLSLITLFFTPAKKINLIRQIGLVSSGLTFIASFFLMLSLSLNNYYFQNIIVYKVGFEFLNLSFLVGFDGISIFFFVLSSFLIFLCIIFIWEEAFLKEYVIILLAINLLLLLIFSVLDVLLFYIFFEAILIPMYLMIGLWGSRERKIRAIYLFFFYTLVGSLCLLLALIYIYSRLGTLNYEYLYFAKFSFYEQCWLWFAFFLSFASKVPLFPFHLWLPEAHVEAPTVGSVLLAGILLKLGTYGLIRFNLNLFPDASIFFSPLVFTLSILGIIYASMSALRQTDLKRIIAYSSVAHMNLVTMGIFSFNSIGIQGSIIQSISHGFVSSAMFFLIGILYKRYHSRQVLYFSGLTQTMPLYSAMFFIFTMANIALPGTSSFVGEFLILLGIFKISALAAILAGLGVILGGPYSLWVYNRICFGNIKLENTLYYKDIDTREFFILSSLLFLVLLLGIYPKFFLRYLQFSSANYLFALFV